MLKEVKLTNFKCFGSLELTCPPLALLCGLNGMGKSSVIQALLVLRQSFTSGELRQGRLVLGGEFADLGTGSDVLFEGAEIEVVELELRHEAIPTPFRLSFDYLRAADRLQSRDADSTEEARSEMLNQWGEVPPLGGDLFYVNAERIGPRKSYNLSETFARLGSLGARGEYALNYLHARQEETLSSSDPRCTDLPSRRLPEVVDHWLQAVTPGAHLELVTIQEADAIISGFSFDRSRRRQDQTLPSHERRLRPVLHPAGLGGPPIPSGIPLPDRESRGSPASPRPDQVGRPRGSRLPCRRAGSRRDAQRPLYRRCPHSRSGRADSSGSDCLSLFRARRGEDGCDLPAGGCRRSPLFLAGRVLRSARGESGSADRAEVLTCER